MIIELKNHTNIKPQGAIMATHAFLPEDYEPPVASGNYMKLQAGENRIRILSAPVLGWEDWTPEKKPVRFHYDSKPAKPIDPSRPVKHFWAMIVWNYKEERIQILHVTQSTIRTVIGALSENEDWGAPYFYDLKITKKGEKVDTEYSIIPCPKKPASEALRQAFHAKPCNLEALFTNADPFASNPSEGFTPGIFEDNQPTEPTLSEDQQLKIISLTQGNDDLQLRILNSYNVTHLSQIPAKHFKAMESNLTKRTGGIK